LRGRCAGAAQHSIEQERSPRVGAQSRLEDDETSDVDGANYQLEMMRCLREVNVDNNTVGWCAALGRRASSVVVQGCGRWRQGSHWVPEGHTGVVSLRGRHRHRYQSTVMGSFQTLELIETFISYAESIKRCVCIVYDPQRASAGGHALKAVRLKESFIQARRAPSACAAVCRQCSSGCRSGLAAAGRDHGVDAAAGSACGERARQERA
jgi:hypothetical protein